MEAKKTTKYWYLPVLLVITTAFIFVGAKYINTDINDGAEPTPSSSTKPLDIIEPVENPGLPSSQSDYRKAGNYLHNGDYANAIKSLEQAILKDPSNISYYSLKSQAELLAGDEDAARTTLEAGLDIKPADDLLNTKLEILNKDNLSPADQEAPRL